MSTQARVSTDRPDPSGLLTFWELSTELLSIAEPDGTFLHVNPAWTRTLGWSRKEIQQTNAMDLVHPDDREATLDVLASLRTPSHEIHDHENRYRTVDGNYRALRWHARTGMDGRVYSITQDVTEDLEGDRRLRESEERFRLAMTQAAIGMAIVGVDGRFLEMNDALCRIVGRPREVLTTLTFPEITHPDDLQVDLEFVAQLEAGEIERYDLEKRYIHADGSSIWVLLSGTAARDETGAPRYYIAQVQDITARKAAERELAETLENLRRSNEALTDFAAIAAHDLKAPLATAASLLEVLAMQYAGRLPDQGRELLGRVRNQVTRLAHRVDGVLRIATVTGMGLVREPADIPELVRAVRDGLGPSAADLDVIVGDCPDVSADLSALAILFQNLIENAANHGATRMDVHADHFGDETVRILVDDDGPGIPQDQRNDVFELFQRGPRSNGTGVGLATCRQIVERHGGSIGIGDSPTGGARIWFTLPVE